MSEQRTIVQGIMAKLARTQVQRREALDEHDQALEDLLSAKDDEAAAKAAQEIASENVRRARRRVNELIELEESLAADLSHYQRLLDGVNELDPEPPGNDEPELPEEEPADDDPEEEEPTEERPEDGDFGEEPSEDTEEPDPPGDDES